MTQRLRVLLADDHPIVRAGVRALLDTERDLEIVGEAGDGASVVRMAIELLPDVVLMDVSMPQVNGVEATKLILAQQPSLRILVLSAHEEPAFARMLFDAGAVGYALKRSASEELVRALRLVASGSTYVDPSLASALPPASTRRHSPRGVAAINLSEREAEVIRLIAQGYTSREMAQTLGLSPRTLETYRARAMSKLSLTSRADLIRYALRSGWLKDT
jgi:DNA-binding NarL/FixJ family response regulator